MTWEIAPFAKQRWYHSPGWWFGIFAVVAGVVFAGGKVKDFYHHWREERRVARAAAAFERGDYQQAILRAKVALAFDAHHVEATRIIAKSLEAVGSPSALQARRRLDSIGGSDAENFLMIAANSWKNGDKATTERALGDVPPEARYTATFHELSAQVAAWHQDFATAATHWGEAVKLDPQNLDFQLAWAAMRLKSKDVATRAASLAALEKLSTDAANGLRARRSLLADAEAQTETSRAVELSAAICASPGATFADQLHRLTILHAARPAEFQLALAQAEQASLSKPRNLYQLLVWMNENGLALAVQEWGAKLPAEVSAEPQIRATLADADARASSWETLLGRLEAETWPDFEFLRFAHLTRAHERLDHETAATAMWAKAIADAQAKPAKLEALGKTVRSWGWDRRAEQALAKLATVDQCPRWVADFLWSAALKDHDSARMLEASRLLVKADPKNVTARNNYISLALLTGRGNDAPDTLARDLYEQEPNNAAVASTYGLSLFQKGLPQEAVKVMKQLSPEQLREPSIALYHGMFLAASGHLAEAKPFLEIAERAPMLAEERALLRRAGEGAETYQPGSSASEVARLLSNPR